MAQAYLVRDAIESVGIETEIVEILSEGDRKLGQALYAIEGAQPGLFTKELERALNAGSIDIAVHSLKDLPTQLAPNLTLLAVSSRASVEDCLIVPIGSSVHSIESLPKSSRIGTSSLRREAQILSVRSDARVSAIRGNILTRIDLLDRGDFDAILLAKAGLDRIGEDLSDRIRIIPLDTSVFVPAPAQGALGIESLASLDAALAAKIRGAIHDSTSEMCTRVERRILRDLEGGCTLPLGVLCRPEEARYRVLAFLGDAVETPSGRQWKGFRRFDILGEDEQILVAQTVQYFRK